MTLAKRWFERVFAPSGPGGSGGLRRAERAAAHSDLLGPSASSRASRNRSKRTRRPGFSVRLIGIGGIILATLILIAGIGVYVFLGWMTNPLHFESLAKAVPGMRVNVLVMGLDAYLDHAGRAVPDFDIHTAVGSRTDTMMLISVDPQTRDVVVISLPRDTRVIIAGRESYGYDKLGHAHAYGRKPGDGANMLIATVSQFLDIPIHYYVRINSSGVARIVDLLGGVEVYVERDMYYHDPYQNLTINLKAGLQVLKGEDAVGFLRYRSDGGDLYRIDRQQRFLKALRDKLFTFGVITKIPSLLSEIADNIDTNMTRSEMIAYARLAAQADMPNLRTEILPGYVADIEDPGKPPRSYWVPKMDECRALIEECIWGVDREANAGITVEVLNGTEVAGLAARFAEELRRQGYAVISVGNDPNPGHEKTEIIDRSRDEDKLRRLSRAVLRYLPEARLGRARPIEGRPDFTVIVGADYAELLVGGDAGGGG